MIQQIKVIILAGAAILMIAGCSSSSKPEPIGEIPEWVLNPIVEDGIAATACVNWSGNMNIDRQSATASARADISKQIDVKVRAMDKTYDESMSTGSAAKASGIFSAVSKQVSQARLKGSRPIKVQPVTIDGSRKLCVMVAVSNSKEIFKEIIENSDAGVSPQDENKLYLEWKESRAQAEMDSETKQ